LGAAKNRNEMNLHYEAMNAEKQLKFDVRLKSASGKDVHRVLKGSFFLKEGALAILEVKTPPKGVVVSVLIPKSVYNKPNGEPYTPKVEQHLFHLTHAQDIFIGSNLEIDGHSFIITKVEGFEDPDDAPPPVTSVSEV
jgi:hypothetical protein